MDMVNFGKWKEVIINILEENRGLVILLFCLPASFIFDIIHSVYNKYQRWTLFNKNINKHHDDQVKRIQKEIEAYNKVPRSKRKWLCTARPNWLSLSTTFFQKKLCHQIDVNLFNILKLDEENLTVRVEPMVTVREIMKYLIPKGYALSVTLEIGDATLGGLAMGTGMTTRSHLVGLYHESIVSYEVILGDGSFVVASANEHTDLYKCLPYSHGSLCFLVGLTLKIVKVKPYIRLTYTPVKGQKEYCDLIRLVSGDTKSDYPITEYVEATIFSKQEAVVMTGNYADYDYNTPVNRVTKWYKPWFYKHVEKFSIKNEQHTELIPLEDYLLRHDRAIFWVVESMLPFGNNPLFRLFFGWLLPPKPAFLKFTTTSKIRAYTFVRQVFQDIVLPLRKLEEQVDTATDLFDVFPLLVYPCRVYTSNKGELSGQIRSPKAQYLIENRNYAMFNDLGIYGVPGYVKKKQKYNAVEAMRKMEKFTRDLGGFSFLYADIFMTKAEFEEMFDLGLYEKVRIKYSAEDRFPHLYEKVKPEIDVFEIGAQLQIN